MKVISKADLSLECLLYRDCKNKMGKLLAIAQSKNTHNLVAQRDSGLQPRLR